MYRALVLDRSNGELTANVQEWESLSDGDTTLSIRYSSLNYKDALAVTGEGKIIRGDFPFIPGIDLVGKVQESDAQHLNEGDWVIGTGWGLGENHWGGYTESLRTKAEYLVRLPDGMTPEQAMIIGTAGFTAMLSVMALQEHGVDDKDGEIVVTGASGGAGSMSIALLSELGFNAVASTGSEDAHDYLRALGASRIVGRDAFGKGPSHPMESAKWVGAIDAVGGKTLATLIAQMDRHGSIASFGNAGGARLETTVYPFILRGVNLLGIDSNTCPNDRRKRAWQQLANLLSDELYERMHSETIGLGDLPETSQRMLRGETRGRIVVDVRQ